MSTVDQALGVAKNISREVRSKVQEMTKDLSPTDLMIINSRVALSLRMLARDLECYTPPKENEDE